MPSGLIDSQTGDDGWNDQSGRALDRFFQPQLRWDRSGEFVPVNWRTAIDHATVRFRAILEKHGPDSVAFCGGGRLDTEAAYLAVKLFKGSIGTNNTDASSRHGSASPGAGYRTSLGADGSPPCLADIDHADCITVWGSDIAETHPEVFERIKARKKAHPSLDWTVIDPREPSAIDPDISRYVRVALGGEIALINAMARRLIDQDAIDHRFIASHTTGFDDFFHLVTDEDYADLVAVSGVADTLVRDLAFRIGRSRAWLNFIGGGIDPTRMGMWKYNSMINLHLLTGQIGKLGAGPFNLTEPPNAMGCCEAGLLAHQLPGHRIVDDPSHRGQVEAFWNRPEGTIPRQPGLTSAEMIAALESGRLKAIWIAATDLTEGWLEQPQVRNALAKAELVIVQDSRHPTSVSHLADVFLPATDLSETLGTYTSPERLVSLREPAVDSRGAAIADWQIISMFARELGYSGFSFQHVGEVWDEFIMLTAGRPCDMSGLSSGCLESKGPTQWPCPSSDHPGTARLYLDRKFPRPDGLARFLMRRHRGPYETPDHDFSVILANGRPTPAQPAGTPSQRGDQGRTRMLRNATGP